MVRSTRAKENTVEVDIEVKWTRKDIEDRLLQEMKSAGLIPIPKRTRQSKKKGKKSGPDEDEGSIFTWPRGGEIRVKARAMMTVTRTEKPAPTATLPDDAPPPPVPSDEPVEFNADMLPDGANVEALNAIQTADPLEAAAKRERLPGETDERPD